MASTQKKTTKSGGKRTQSKSAAPKSTKKKTTSTAKPRKKAAPAAPSYHREIGGVVCLVLAFFGSFGYFGVKAAFIDSGTKHPVPIPDDFRKALEGEDL